LRPAFIERLIALLGANDICVPRVGEYDHPLAAVYRLSVLETVQHLLEHNRLRPVYLFESRPTRVVNAEELRAVDPEFASLRNVNTPEEYAQALAEFERETA
jgi:molybdopterin-guanine dinucleotide biosynthesis protein A